MVNIMVKQFSIALTAKRVVKVVFIASLFGLLIGCAGAPQVPEVKQPKMPEINWPKPQLNGSIYQPGRSMALYQNRSARQVGDIITVILNEKTQASKKANTSVDKGTDMEAAPTSLLGQANLTKYLTLGIEDDKSFDGSGSSDQSNNLTGNITCLVTNVLPNGNLIISGQKKLTLNRGDEYVTISGLIRPEDVADDNTVSSQRIANAQIAYTGVGELAEANQMGWISRFFLSPLWPF